MRRDSAKLVEINRGKQRGMKGNEEEREPFPFFLVVVCSTLLLA